MRYATTIMVLISILVSGCSSTTEVNTNGPEPKVINEVSDLMPEKVLIPFDEVTKHNDRNDCWIALHGKVYDMTPFVAMHPGGTAILEGCGKDASELYETRPMGSGTPHSEAAREKLPDYYIGDLI